MVCILFLCFYVGNLHLSLNEPLTDRFMIGGVSSKFKTLFIIFTPPRKKKNPLATTGTFSSHFQDA